MRTISTAVERTDYWDVFRKFDSDCNGHITVEELGQVMAEFGRKPAVEELVALVDEVDKNSNGTIEFEEFVQMMARRKNWTDDLPQPIHQHFQTLVNATMEMHEAFGCKEKYAMLFMMMADPLEAFLNVINSSTATEDVFVATLSGSLQTILAQLNAKKVGKDQNDVFIRCIGAVTNALKDFVNVSYS